MTTDERLDPRATALIVFDMQNGGVRGNDPERARWIADSQIVEHCVDLVAAARAAKVRVFYVRNNRRADGADQHDTITDQSIAAARANRPAATPPANQYDMIDELKPEVGDFVVDKIRTGGFSSTALDTLFRANRIADVIICGVRTTVGVATTVRDGRDLGYNMVLASDATGGIAPEDHEWMLRKVFPMFARVRTVAQIRQMLG